MQSTRSFTDKLFLIIKGLGMGAANKVPGVSGGVVAFVAGFYEEFIYSLQKINVKALKFLINGRFKSFFQYINGRFLSLLILGMIVSYFSISKLLDFLIVNYELFVWSVFFGMIIGSIYYLNKDFKEWNTPTLFSSEHHKLNMITHLSLSSIGIDFTSSKFSLLALSLLRSQP